MDLGMPSIACSPAFLPTYRGPAIFISPFMPSHLHVPPQVAKQHCPGDERPLAGDDSLGAQAEESASPRSHSPEKNKIKWHLSFFLSIIVFSLVSAIGRATRTCFFSLKTLLLLYHSRVTRTRFNGDGPRLGGWDRYSRLRGSANRHLCPGKAEST